MLDGLKNTRYAIHHRSASIPRSLPQVDLDVQVQYVPLLIMWAPRRQRQTHRLQTSARLPSQTRTGRSLAVESAPYLYKFVEQCHKKPNNSCGLVSLIDGKTASIHSTRLDVVAQKNLKF